MCGGRSSILHYGPLIETNYLYAPTPNGQSPSASLNKSNTPPPPCGTVHGRIFSITVDERPNPKYSMTIYYNADEGNDCLDLWGN